MKESTKGTSFDPAPAPAQALPPPPKQQPETWENITLKEVVEYAKRDDSFRLEVYSTPSNQKGIRTYIGAMDFGVDGLSVGPVVKLVKLVKSIPSPKFFDAI